MPSEPLSTKSESDTVTCIGCGEALPFEASGVLWCRSEFGLTTLRVHKDQTCAAEALRKKGWRLYPGNQPPLSEKEKMARDRIRSVAG